MNRCFFYIIAPLLTAWLTASGAAAEPAALKEYSLSELEQELASVDSELSRQAAVTLRRGVGSLGYRSRIHGSPNAKEWIRIDLEEETVIDAVVLTPILFSETRTGLQAEGFPTAFRILAGTGQDTNEVAAVSEVDRIMPRTAPLAVTFPPAKAAWVIIEATTLTSRMSASHYFLQLSEIMVFSGRENVALNQPVTIPPGSPNPHTSIGQRFLTDGFTPYIMNAAYGGRSKSLLIAVTETNQRPTLTFDLKTTVPVNQINFHSANLSYGIPMGNFSTWAVPSHVRVLGAVNPDFSDAVPLCEYRQESIYDNGPIIMRRFPAAACRYVRVEIIDHNPVVALQPHLPQISFSEIEIIAEGRNAALGAPVTASPNLAYPNETLIRITDGLNYYGSILPLREWMSQLSRRHDLEVRRPLIAAELNRRYEQQKINLRRLGGLAGLLAAGIVIAILVERLIHLREMARLRERFAADLHDELGADLHTIGLLSDLAGDALQKPQELAHLLQEIRTTTEETGAAVRMVSRISSGLPYSNLAAIMQQAAERVVVHLRHDFTIEGAELLEKLKPRTRADLFLFYKESLINICRHAEATTLQTHLKAAPGKIELTMADNGLGLPDMVSKRVPQSLRRRARLMGAQVETEQVHSGGTRIKLTLKTGRTLMPGRRKR